MALMHFYDVTGTDESQLAGHLQNTDHHCVYHKEPLSNETVDPDAEVISVFVSSSVTSELLRQMPRLKLITCRSTGFNNVDLAVAEAQGVTVVNVPVYGENTVAEYAFALLLTLTRRVPEAAEAGMDASRDSMIGVDLAGKTMGVVGTGHIGQKTIAIARGFGMEVVAYDPYPNQDLTGKLGFSYTDLDDLLQRADAVSLHAPYTPQTHHLINEASFKRMKPTAYLINTSRGELVDIEALVEALQDNTIAGAGLDVVEDEVLLKREADVDLLRESGASQEMLKHAVSLLALSKMPNCIVTPHNAYNTVEAVGRINKTTVDNIVSFWNGEVTNKVKPAPKAAGQLVLIRHAESAWNAEGRWTGWNDQHLSERGFRQASELGQAVQESGVRFDKAYCSELVRAKETLEAIINVTEQLDAPIERVAAINERDYGDYTGKNKWEMRDLLGEDKFNAIRRGWDEPVPNGETLKMVYERAVPWYRWVVVPQLQNGQNILIVAHGNSLRALMKYLESIPDEEIGGVEMTFGHIVTYNVDAEGKSVYKKVTAVEFGDIPA